MDGELYNAARSGDVSFLSKEGIKTRNILSELTPNRSSVLHIAAESDQLEFFQEAARLCSPLLVKHANSKGETPLHSAVRGCSTHIVDFIIKHTKELFSDIEQGHEVEGYKEWLLRMENTDGDNALHLAARHNLKSDVASLLIQADPQLSAVVNNKSNQSACFIALSKGNGLVADVILRSTTCSLSGHINGMVALHAATVALLSNFEDVDLVRKIVEAAPDMINQADDIGWTPLHYAASLGYRVLVELFLKKNKSAAYELDKQDGRSALHIAASVGEVESMKAILKACPDCADLVDNRGRNALHTAVLASQEDAVKFMLSLPGTTLFTEADQDGNTPLRLAILRNSYVIVTMIHEEAKYNEKSIDSGNSFLDKELRCVHFDMQNCQQKVVQLVQDALIVDNNHSSSSKNEVVDDDYGYYQFSATLIATVTFTAAFTLPGGFIQSGGKDEGLAVLVSKPAFQAFIIFDVSAFFASLAIVILLLFYNHTADTGSSIYTIEKAVMIYLIISYYGMALAFCCGLYVVLGNNSAFSIVGLVLSVLGTLVAIFGSLAIGFPDFAIRILKKINNQRREYEWKRKVKRVRKARMKDILSERLDRRM